MTPLQYLLGAGAGSVVGFSLGLMGGGGSVLAVPLLLYAVGVDDPHVAIGTSALAVAANAGANLVTHARLGHVKWRCASVFALAGVAGASIGSTLGKALDGQRLLGLFAGLMIVVALQMLRGRSIAGAAAVSLNRENGPKLVVLGAATGAVAGFFGIGGGFLIVPALITATGMPVLNAVGSSLLAVAAFGVTTAFNYARAGWVDWMLAAAFIVGGVVGGAAGARVAVRLARRQGALNRALAAMIFGVGLYTLYRSARLLGLV